MSTIEVAPPTFVINLETELLPTAPDEIIVADEAVAISGLGYTCDRPEDATCYRRQDCDRSQTCLG